MDLRITQAAYEPMDQRTIEMVERKGIGHPDTICDKVAEELSRALSRYYLGSCHRILHHNVDKALLVGGQTQAWFGGGEIIEPIRLILSGRAALASNGKQVPLGRLAVETARGWLREHLPCLPDEGIIVDYLMKPGSVDLCNLVEAEDCSVPLANDTSLGVGHAPLSETERLVLSVEHVMEEFDQVGQDVKIMALRRKERIDLTVAAAFISSRTPNEETYRMVKEEIAERVREAAARVTEREVQVWVNTGDKPEQDSYFLTVTGTSAEAGDDGQVGRGNRVNGLITPFRPMSMEAAAGKNPVSHVGKIYNVMAGRIASYIAEAVEGAEVACYILSQIGKPINDPMTVHIEVAGACRDAAAKPAQEAVEQVLSRWRELQTDFVHGRCQIA
ncbi:MAG: methionine adenosyltransferase [Armatimonadota bacterium]